MNLSEAYLTIQICKTSSRLIENCFRVSELVQVFFFFFLRKNKKAIGGYLFFKTL